MKRNQLYAIDPLAKTVVVTRKFMEKASQFGEEYNLLQRFEKAGLKLSVKQPPRRKKQDSKPAMLTYAEMITYIAMLDDADEMMTQFDTTRESARVRPDRVAYVNNWFRKEFPHYDDIPEFDDDGKIIHNPNPIGPEIALVS